MKKMESNPEDHQNIDKKWSRAGHLFVLEKRLAKLGSILLTNNFDQGILIKEY